MVATGGPLTYQWYQVPTGFDLTKHRGAYPAAGALISGATGSSYSAPAFPNPKGYWVRIHGACGSVDSEIAVVVPRPTGAPDNVLAEAGATGVSVTWSAGTAGSGDFYQVERKVSSATWGIAGLVSTSTFAFTDTATVPGGMAVYRVKLAAGAAYLPLTSLAVSDASNRDFANLMIPAYESVASGVPVRARQITELRLAVNALCDALGVPQEFPSEETMSSSLAGQPISADHFTELMTRINSIRTNGLLGLSAASFTSAVVPGRAVLSQDMLDLRNALK